MNFFFGKMPHGRSNRIEFTFVTPFGHAMRYVIFAFGKITRRQPKYIIFSLFLSSIIIWLKLNRKTSPFEEPYDETSHII